MSTDLFSWSAAQAAKDEAVQRVERHARPEWLRCALLAVYDVARYRAEFTTDAVWALLDARDVPPPHEPRAMGPVMKRAVNLGYCAQTDRVRPSVRVVNHGRPIAVYRSLVLP